mgnify:CR=1 FL=1
MTCSYLKQTTPQTLCLFHNLFTQLEPEEGYD